MNTFSKTHQSIFHMNVFNINSPQSKGEIYHTIISEVMLRKIIVVSGLVPHVYPHK